MAFQLSETVNKDKVFLVRRSELEGRLDPDYVRYLRKSQTFMYPAISLGNILRYRPQYGANELGLQRIGTNQPRYIRITDIDEFGVLSQELGATADNIEDKYILVDGDLLLARSGNTVGKAYLHTPKDYPCFFAGYMIRFKINEEIALSSYVFTVTQLGIYKEWVNAVQRSAGQPNINAEEYRNYKLPLPPFDIQKRIVTKINIAYAAKKQKEAQAKQQLDSIDTYLMKELGIEPQQEEENSISLRMFISNFSEVSGGRFDADFYSKRYKSFESRMMNSPYPLAQLNKIAVSIFQGIGRNQTDKQDCVLLKVKNILGNGEISFEDIEYVDAEVKGKVLEQGDIISPFIGEAIKQYKFSVFIKNNDQNYTVDNNTGVIRLSCEVSSNYIASFLMSSCGKWQINKFIGGGGVPFLGSHSVKKFQVVLPPLEKQNKIAAHIQGIRDQAKQLRAEAVAGLEQAKQEVEAMILRRD
ncbi:MAG TPA: restriction endonuclease subunit S [Desulfuromonadaceae bacterium]|jgi:restriction endonuclease S subunit